MLHVIGEKKWKSKGKLSALLEELAMDLLKSQSYLIKMNMVKLFGKNSNWSNKQ